MNQAAEEVSAPLEGTRRPRKSAESGILGAILRMGSRVRIGVAALGLLGAAESGCAHVPKPVPPSQAQAERQVCIALRNNSTEKNSNLSTMVLDALSKYLSTEYSNIHIQHLQLTNSPHIMTENEIALAVDDTCDDIIEVDFSSSTQRNVPNSTGHGSPKDTITFRAQALVFNLTKGTVVANGKGSTTYSEANTECGLRFIEHGSAGGEYKNECREKNIPGTQLIANLRDGVDDLVKDDLLDDYHPEQLPPLSLALIEKATMQKNYGTVEVAGEQRLIKFFELASAFRKKYPQATDYFSRLDKLFAEVVRSTSMQRISVTNGRIPIRGEENNEKTSLDPTGIFFETGETILVGPWQQNKNPFSPFFAHYFAFAITADGSRQGFIWNEEVDQPGIQKAPPRKIPDGMVFFRPGEDPTRPGALVEEFTKAGVKGVIRAVPAIGKIVSGIVVTVDKIMASPGEQTSTTSSGNGEIQVQTGATGYLSIPCTDTGIATRLSEKTTSTCETVGGPACVITNVPPGKYVVSARRSGGCKVKEKGPVEVLVEAGKRVNVDFSPQFRH